MNHIPAAERVAQIRNGAAETVKAYRGTVTFHTKNKNSASLEEARRDLAYAEAEVKTLAGLSDLDVLNRHYERQIQDRINLNDRLAKIYRSRDTDIHGSAQAYREQAVQSFRDNVDQRGRTAMGRWADSWCCFRFDLVLEIPLYNPIIV